MVDCVWFEVVQPELLPGRDPIVINSPVYSARYKTKHEINHCLLHLAFSKMDLRTDYVVSL